VDPGWLFALAAGVGIAAACGLRAYILPSENRTGERGLVDVLQLVR